MELHGLNSCRLGATEHLIYCLLTEVITSRPRLLGEELDFNARATGKIPESVKEGSLLEPSLRNKMCHRRYTIYTTFASLWPMT